MAHLQQVATTRTTIDDVLQTVMRRATSNTLEPGMIFHGGRRLSGNGWHDASFVYERVEFIHTIIRDVRMSSKVEPCQALLPTPTLALPLDGGGQGWGSGQELKGSEGINARSFGQS